MEMDTFTSGFSKQLGSGGTTEFTLKQGTRFRVDNPKPTSREQNLESSSVPKDIDVAVVLPEASPAQAQPPAHQPEPVDVDNIDVAMVVPGGGPAASPLVPGSPAAPDAAAATSGDAQEIDVAVVVPPDASQGASPAPAPAPQPAPASGSVDVDNIDVAVVVPPDASSGAPPRPAPGSPGSPTEKAARADAYCSAGVAAVDRTVAAGVEQIASATPSAPPQPSPPSRDELSRFDRLFLKHSKDVMQYMTRVVEDADSIDKEYVDSFQNQAVDDFLPNQDVIDGAWITKFNQLKYDKQNLIFKIIMDLLRRKSCLNNTSVVKRMLPDIVEYVATKVVPEMKDVKDVHDLVDEVVRWNEELAKHAHKFQNEASMDVALMLSTLDPDLETTCYLDSDTGCQSELILMRRRYRASMEDALSLNQKEPFELLPIKQHLFSLNTYRVMQNEITEFMALTQPEKVHQTILLQKKFEMMALNELLVVMAELYQLSYDLLKAFENNTEKSVDDIALVLLKMERLCSRTWQQTFSEKLPATQSRCPSNIAVGVPVAQEARLGIQAGGGGGSNSGGGGSMLTTEQQDNLKGLQQTIYKLQNNLRNVFSELKRQLAVAFTSTSNKNSNIRLMYQNNTLSRIQFLKANIEQMVYKYLEIRTIADLPDNLTINHNERHRMRNMVMHGKMTKGDVVSYRFSEERTRIMYALKLVRFVGQILALWVAQQSYLEEYAAAVYDKKVYPPPLTRMLYIFLSIDATIQLAVVLILVLLSYVMVDKRNPISQTFVINDEFIRDFLAEYFVTTAMTAVLGVMIGGVVHRRKFFEVEQTGRDGVEMFRIMMIAVCGIVGIIPIFMLL